MREVIPRQLWLGNAVDARNPRRLHELGIAAIVDLAVEELPSRPTRDMTYCRFPLIDGAGNAPALLSATIDITATLVRNRIPTLVSCGAGMSRSPAIVAAALARVRNDVPDHCLQQLLAGNPHDVSPPLWADVKNVYNDIVG